MCYGDLLQYQKRQGSQGCLDKYCSSEILAQWEEVGEGKRLLKFFASRDEDLNMSWSCYIQYDNREPEAMRP
jgi:hypothetical protein